MFFTKLARRERYITYITAIIIVGVFFDRLVLSPIAKKMEKSNKEIYTREQRLKRFLRTLSQGEAITAEYKEYTGNIKQIVSDEEETAKFLSEIEKLAGKAAISLADIKPGKIEEEGRFRKYTVRLEIESKMGSLANFIYQLETLPQLLRVESFSMAPRKQKSSQLKVSMIVTQLLITEASVPAVSAPSVVSREVPEE